MHREDFDMLTTDTIYLDSGATALKPRILSEVISDYYNNYSVNSHRGDYDLSLKVDAAIDHTRELVKDFINARTIKEIAFTSGATASLNQIIFGYYNYFMHAGDEVIITEAEHASNVLPWFELRNSKGIVVRTIPLENNKVTLENVKKVITPKTKVISIAMVTNTLGDLRPVKEIIKYAHENNISVILDGAQAVPHMKVDVQDLDCDFMAFSAHKMCGPTGVGILYAKQNFMNDMYPTVFGGGMNSYFELDGSRMYSNIPIRFEAGTLNIAGIIGFGKILEYLNDIGMDNIHKYELELKDYALSRLKEIDKIKIYNENTDSGIIIFNLGDIFAQDLACYLNKYNICVRAGNHCAKMVHDVIDVNNTVRVSLYFYNTKEEIDKLVEVLKNPNIKNEII